ncbi:acid-sensing ion channel 5-like [Clytia hemisphaerica]|uniref:acid-sensing ion channel 5-like n=1 Tax=Clytia hemisphaerica TaxID=252671 RepID=UPI0034D4F15D|eukprot:TCONS_00018078-protein
MGKMFKDKVLPFVTAVKAKNAWKEETVHKRDNYIENVTVHGVSKAVNSKRSERYFWISLVISCVFALSYGLYLMVHKYRSREVNLHIQDQIHDKLELPSITICSNNRIKFDYVPGEQGPGDLTTAFSEGFYEFASKFPPFCARFKGHCNFTEEFSTFSRNDPCVTWNMDGLIKQELPGLNSGVRMMFFVNETSDRMQQGFIENSISVVIHFAREYPSIYFDRLELTPGVETRIELSKKMFLRLPEPYPSNCRTDNAFMDITKRWSYTRTSCLELCYNRQGLKECGDVLQPRFRCLIPDWMYQKYKQNRTVADINACYFTLFQNFDLSNNEICDCPSACSEVIYSRRVHTVPMNEKQIFQQLDYYDVNVGDQQKFKESLFVFSFYYPRLGFELVSEKPAYVLSDVANDFGGLLGLCIGASIMSLFELIIIFCLSVFPKWQFKGK